MEVPLVIPTPLYQLIRDKCDRNIWPDMVMRGKRFSALEAQEARLVDAVADESELIDKAIELAESLGEKDRFAF